MYIVYVLKSQKDGRRYVGMTGALERRLSEHERGNVKSTKHRRPIRLVYQEEFSTKEAAATREKFFKTGKGRELLNSIEKGA